MIQLFTTDGRLLFRRNLENSAGSIAISLPSLPKGVYLLRLKTKEEYLVEKVVIQ